MSNYMHRHEADLAWSPPDPALGALRTKLLLDGTRPGSGAFVFGLARLRSGEATEFHFRRQAELIYVTHGEARFSVGAEQVALGRHGCMYLPPEAIRSISATGPQDLHYAFTVARENEWTREHTPEIAASGQDFGTAPPACLRWEDTEAWQPVEPSKGLRIRFKRLMDRTVKREMIAGIGLIDPGTHYTLHYHDQPEIYFIEAGEGIVYVEGTAVRVRPGSCLDIGGKVVHGADSLGSEPLSIFYVYGCQKAGHTVNWTAVEDVYVIPKTLS
jgi:mannose-6-phosphate isomerase-like protein (cupin superfamily)